MFQNLKIGRFHQLIFHVLGSGISLNPKPKPLSCTCIYYTFLSRLLLQKCAGKIHHLIHLADMSKGFLFGSCKGIGSTFRSGLTEWGVGCSWDQMNTVLEKLSSSARELSYYHSGEGPLLFLSLFVAVPLPLCDVDWLDSEVLSSWPFSTHFWSECLWQAWTSTLLPHEVWILQCRRWDFYLFCRFATLH